MPGSGGKGALPDQRLPGLYRRRPPDAGDRKAVRSADGGGERFYRGGDDGQQRGEKQADPHPGHPLRHPAPAVVHRTEQFLCGFDPGGDGGHSGQDGDPLRPGGLPADLPGGPVCHRGAGGAAQPAGPHGGDHPPAGASGVPEPGQGQAADELPGGGKRGLPPPGHPGGRTEHEHPHRTGERERGAEGHQRGGRQLRHRRRHAGCHRRGWAHPDGLRQDNRPPVLSGRGPLPAVWTG